MATTAMQGMHPMPCAGGPGAGGWLKLYKQCAMAQPFASQRPHWTRARGHTENPLMEESGPGNPPPLPHPSLHPPQTDTAVPPRC